MDSLIANINGPWLIIGDLNERVSEGEKIGGRPLWRKHLFLKKFLQQTGGIDMGFSSRRLSWENNQDGNAIIKERLDRAVADKLWLEIFSSASVQHMIREKSNHCQILLETVPQRKIENCPFRYFKAWNSYPLSNHVVDSAWNKDWKGGMHCHRLIRSLSTTATTLKKWKHNHFGYMHTKIKELEQKN